LQKTDKMHVVLSYVLNQLPAYGKPLSRGDRGELISTPSKSTQSTKERDAINVNDALFGGARSSRYSDCSSE
jgi:hypothetical protein